MEFIIGKNTLIIFLNNHYILLQSYISSHKNNVSYISYIYLFEDSWKFFYLGILKYEKKKKMNKTMLNNFL